MTCMIIFSVFQSLLPNLADLAEKILAHVVDDAFDVIESGIEGVGLLLLLAEEGIAGNGGRA